MTVSAHDVAVVLRERLPGLRTKKLHKLLYYCQGHHLATFGEPLFPEAVEAWDRGPVVASLWRAEKHGHPAPPIGALGEAQLNTIGYVLSRYGALTGRDLEVLSHAEPPWREADARRRAGGSDLIPAESLRSYFSTAGAAGADDEQIELDPATVAAWLAQTPKRPGPGVPDDIDTLRARLRG